MRKFVLKATFVVVLSWVWMSLNVLSALLMTQSCSPVRSDMPTTILVFWCHTSCKVSTTVHTQLCLDHCILILMQQFWTRAYCRTCLQLLVWNLLLATLRWVHLYWRVWTPFCCHWQRCEFYRCGSTRFYHNLWGLRSGFNFEDSSQSDCVIVHHHLVCSENAMCY